MSLAIIFHSLRFLLNLLYIVNLRLKWKNIIIICLDKMTAAILKIFSLDARYLRT